MMLDRKRFVGVCLCIVAVFSFGFFSGKESQPQEYGTVAELRAVSSTADEIGLQVPAFKELASKVKSIESKLPEFATKADVDSAVAQVKELVEDARLKATYSESIRNLAEASCSAEFDAVSDLQSKVDALTARVEALESSCSKLSSSVSAPVKSGGSNGGVSVAQVPVSSVTYGTVTVSDSQGSWGSSVAMSQPVYPNVSETYRVVQPYQPRTVTTVQSTPSTQCYIDENGNQVCNQGVQSSVSSVRRGLLGFRRSR